MLSCGDISAAFISYGAAVQSVTVPSRSGRPVDICLGYDDLTGYENGQDFIGAVIGRYANRIAGAKFNLDGHEYRLTANEGKNHLHGGHGFNKRVFDCAEGDNFAEYTIFSPDGEDGYPGNLEACVTYVLAENELQMTFRAVSDADTVVNLTSHAYFNLSGGGSIEGHVLQINSDSVTEPDSELIPTGNLMPVEGTRFDFRQPRTVGKGYDHNYVLGEPGTLRQAAELYSPDTGICMTVLTTMPGLQFYSGGAMSSTTGKGGTVYVPESGLCLETQFWPDSPNKTEFPSPVLRAGAVYEHTTIWRFSTR